jgi:hypothetical protein
MTPHLSRQQRRLLTTDRGGRHPIRPTAPDHVVHGRLGKLTLELQGELGDGQRAGGGRALQRPSLRQVFVPTSVLGSDGGVVGDAREPELPTDANWPVTTTVTRRVMPGHEATYEAFLAGISGAARASPAISAWKSSAPSRSKRRVPDRLPPRFGRHLRSRLDSPEHAAWQARAEPHVAGPIQTQVLTGPESWFTLPTQPGRPAARPTRWPS